jgi:hypothetical protein
MDATKDDKVVGPQHVLNVESPTEVSVAVKTKRHAGRSVGFAWVLLYMAIALPCLLFLSLWMPPNEAPDEWTGIVRADSLRHGELMGRRLAGVDASGQPAPQAGISADWSLLRAAFVFAPNVAMADRSLIPALIAQQRAIAWDGHSTPMMVANTAPYLAGAAGLQLGKSLGFGPYDAIRIGRVVSALGCALIAAAGLWLAPRGHALLLATLALPMSLSLAASFNMDGMLIALSVLASGLLLREGVRARLVAALALAILIAAKPAYAPLALLLVARDGTRPAMRVAALAVALLPGLVWFLAATSLVATNFLAGEAYRPGPLWHGDPSAMFTTLDRRAQVGVLLVDPWLVLRLPWELLVCEGANLAREMIGVLVQLNLPLPDWVYRMWSLVLPVATLGCVLGRGKKGQFWSGLIAGVALCGAVWLVILSQYVSWTPVGAVAVIGTQGRYLLPVLAFLPCALPALGGSRGIRLLAEAVTVLAASSALVVLPGLVFATYYR